METRRTIQLASQAHPFCHSDGHSGGYGMRDNGYYG